MWYNIKSQSAQISHWETKDSVYIRAHGIATMGLTVVDIRKEHTSASAHWHTVHRMYLRRWYKLCMTHDVQQQTAAHAWGWTEQSDHKQTQRFRHDVAFLWIKYIKVRPPSPHLSVGASCKNICLIRKGGELFRDYLIMQRSGGERLKTMAGKNCSAGAACELSPQIQNTPYVLPCLFSNWRPALSDTQPSSTLRIVPCICLITQAK